MNTFFAARAVVPQLYATAGTVEDPCARVYPANTWRQATLLDYQGLVGRSLLEGGIISAKTPTYVFDMYLRSI